MPEWIIEYWGEWAFGFMATGIVWMLGKIWGKQKSQTVKLIEQTKQQEEQAKQQAAQAERQKAMEDGLKGLLHDRINERYNQCEDKGFANIHDRENLEALYDPYHVLGGNGTGTDLYNKARDLPVKPVERG